MKKLNKVRVLYVLVGLVLFLSVVPLASAGEAPLAEVAVSEYDIVFIPPGGAEGMSVKMIGPEGSVLEVYGSAGPVSWDTGNTEDGNYNYEVNVTMAGSGDESRTIGLFKVINGVISNHKSSHDLQRQSSGRGLWHRIFASILDFIIPSVHAADVTVSDGSPTLYFDDTDGGVGWDFQIVVDDASNQFLIQQSTGGSTPFFIDADAGLFNIGNFISAEDGDVQLCNKQLVIDRDTGNVGIGTTTPTEAVAVRRSGETARFSVVTFNTTNQPSQYILSRAGGTSGSPAAVQNLDNLGLFSFRGYTGSGFTGSRATITGQASQNWTPTANGTSLKFSTTQNGTTSPSVVMEITHDKKVKINGTELNVPDYVFEKDYKLMPLEELKAYIEKEKRLPNMASTAEVKSKGLDLGGNQMALLQKIEELTLYTIDQHEILKEQKAEMTALQKENADLRKLLETRFRALEELVK